MTPRVLLVEDESAIACGLIDNFTAEGFETEHVTRGDMALAAIRRCPPDLIVLDIMLPGRSGLDVLRDLRREGVEVPVLLLTAKNEIVDKVVGLELGADDYVAKPFALAELLARVRALLRRTRGTRAGSVLELGTVQFDFRALVASDTTLTTRDLLVMRALAERRGEVVSRADLVEEVCGLDSDITLRSVDNHVVALRRAIGDNPRRPRWLHSVRGIGYRLEGDVDGETR